MRSKLIYLLASVLLVGTLQAQNRYVATGEWFWDTDPGNGNGTPITAVDGNFDDAIEAVLESSSNIPALGVHTFNIRVQDPSGGWGPIFTTLIDSWESSAAAPSTNISMAEYFWDTDPGEGSGTPMLAADGTFDEAIEEVVESTVVNLALGVHKFSVRVQDPNGAWGPVFTMVIDSWESTVTAQDFNVSMAEFFWDTDPGEGSGTPMLASDGNFNEAVEAIMANSGNIPGTLGPHVLYVRAREDEGVWGPTFATVVDVWANVSTARSSFVKSAEYFFDVDPGPGNATPILAQDGNFNQTIEAIIGGGIPAPVAQGIHTLYIRPMDEVDEWGPTFGIVVNIDTTLGAPPFVTMMSGPDEICEQDLEDPFVYTATQNVGTSFTWTATGGSIISGAGTHEVTVNWDGVAPYSIKVVECDVTAVCDSVEFGINVLQPVTVNNTAMICAGDSIFLGGVWQNASGQYTDTYQAANGCDSSIVTTLTVSGPIVAQCTGEDVLCFGGSDGTASVVVTGGTGTIDYDWGPFGNTQTITGLAAGTYSVSVTDSLGCTATCSVTISEPTELMLQCSGIDGDCTNGNLGQGCVNATGGTPPYAYLWSNGETTDCIDDLDPGQYCVTVTDGNGCQDTCCFTISVDPGYFENEAADLCEGDSLFLEGAWQYGGGQYTDMYTTSGGCDSTVVTTVTMVDTFYTVVNLTIMIGDSAFLAGEWQHTAGLYHDTLESVITGCDSIVGTNLMISPVGIVEHGLEVEVYPNPANSGQFITAQFSEKLEEVRVEVLDMSGRVVYRRDHFNTNQIQLQVDLAMGMYRLRLIADEREFGRKLMIR